MAESESKSELQEESLKGLGKSATLNGHSSIPKEEVKKMNHTENLENGESECKSPQVNGDISDKSPLDNCELPKSDKDSCESDSVCITKDSNKELNESDNISQNGKVDSCTDIDSKTLASDSNDSVDKIINSSETKISNNSSSSSVKTEKVDKDERSNDDTSTKKSEEKSDIVQSVDKVDETKSDNQTNDELKEEKSLDEVKEKSTEPENESKTESEKESKEVTEGDGEKKEAEKSEDSEDKSKNSETLTVEEDKKDTTGAEEVKKDATTTPSKEKKTPKKKKEVNLEIVKRVTRSSSGITKPVKYIDPDPRDIIDDDDDIRITKEVKKNEESDIEMIEESDPLAISESDVKKAKETHKGTTFQERLKSIKQREPLHKGGSGKDNSNVIIIDTNTLLKGQGSVSTHHSSASTHHSSAQNKVTSTVSAQTTASNATANIQTAIQTITGGNPAMQGLQSAYLNAIQQVLVAQGGSSISNPHYIATLQQYYNTLGALQDDAYVIEAPSFIVPYVMEGKPVESIRDYLDRIKREHQEVEEKRRKEEEKRKKEDDEKKKKEEEELEKKKKEEEEEKKKSEVEKESEEEKEKDKEIEMEVDEESKEEKEEEKEENSSIKDDKKDTIKDDIKDKGEDDKKDKEEDDKKDKVEDDKKDKEEDDKKDKEEDDKENKEEDQKMEVDIEVKDEKIESYDPEIKEVETEPKKEKEEEEIKEIASSENKENKKDEKPKPKEEEVIELDKDDKEDFSHLGRWEGYYKTALGKFFLELGLNHTQEFIQADLLKMQKRRVEKLKTNPTKQDVIAIKSLERQLNVSKEKNKPFYLQMKTCKFCSYKTESDLVMERHLESPHMVNYTYKCNFCEFETRGPQVILFHTEAEHNVRGRLERAPAFFQCPLCPFEDNNKSKMTRHSFSCAKKFKADKNCDLTDWEPPAKIPKIHRGRPNVSAFGKAFDGLKMQNILPKNLGGLNINLQNAINSSLLNSAANVSANSIAGRGRGRPVGSYKNITQNIGNRSGSLVYQSRSPGLLQPMQGVTSAQQLSIANQVLQSVTQGGSNRVPRILPAASAGSLLPGLAASSSITIQSVQNKSGNTKAPQQPSISITPLPRGGSQSSGNKSGATTVPSAGNSQRPAFVICEICDGYIKDLEQLRNHMNLIHKVKIHPKMIYNRPPLNCQKCQHRFFTDQGLERHLLGTHGLVTSSMQEAANKGKDAGRCPICGKVFQWKLLNHVSRDHKMTLKPAHLSYKCTVCTATFNMYRLFENHVYSAHSVVNKNKSNESGGNSTTSSSSSAPAKKPVTGSETPLKINDEITIIPQPAAKSPKSDSKASPKKDSPSVSKEITITKVGSRSSSRRSGSSNSSNNNNGSSSSSGGGVEVISLDDSPQKRQAEEEPPKKRTRETATSKRARTSS